MRFYPCGVMVVGQRLTKTEVVEGEQAKTLEHHGIEYHGQRMIGPGPAYKVVNTGRSVSRFIVAGGRGQLAMIFDEPWKVMTISCLGPCLLEHVTFGSDCIYPPSKQPVEASLFIIPERVLQAAHPMSVILSCRPELFMLDADDEPREVFYDSEGRIRG